MEFIQDLYLKEVDGLYRFVLQYSENAESAMDIVHDVFIIALDKAEYLKKHGCPEGWLYVTAKKLLLREYKRRKRRLQNVDFEELVAQIRDTKADEMMESVEENPLYALLTRQEYEIVDLIYNQGYKGKDAARLLHINESTLRVKLLRIRKKIVDSREYEAQRNRGKDG